MRKVVTTLVALAVLGAGGYYGYRYLVRPKAPQFRTAAVERGDLVLAVTATGTLNAVTVVQVGSQISGTIKTLSVDYNSRVRKGQAIAQLDSRLLEASVAQAKGNLDNVRAGLERARVVVADAARTLRRNRGLVADGFIAQADVDSAQTAYEQALVQQQAAEAQIAQARGALTVAETNLGYATIYSPVDGTVISRNVDVGQTVAASFQTPTLFTIAQDLTKMQIDTSVDESDIGQVKAGQVTTFTVDAYPDRTFSGTVHQVRNAPIIVQNVVTYDAIVRVDNRELLLKPGMTANVTIPTQKFEGILKIPNAALRYRPSAAVAALVKPAGRPNGGAGGRPGRRQGGAAEGSPAGRPEGMAEGRPGGSPGGRRAGQGPRVFKVGPDGNPLTVPVKLGPSDGTFTQLVEGRLVEGDLLITDEGPKKNSTGGGGPPGMGMFR